MLLVVLKVAVIFYCTEDAEMYTHSVMQYQQLQIHRGLKFGQVKTFKAGCVSVWMRTSLILVIL